MQVEGQKTSARDAKRHKSWEIQAANTAAASAQKPHYESMQDIDNSNATFQGKLNFWKGLKEVLVLCLTASWSCSREGSFSHCNCLGQLAGLIKYVEL